MLAHPELLLLYLVDTASSHERNECLNYLSLSINSNTNSSNWVTGLIGL